MQKLKYLYVLAFVAGTQAAMAVGTADSVITGIAADSEATFTAVKAIAVPIFGALIGVGIFRKVWGKFVSR